MSNSLPPAVTSPPPAEGAAGRIARNGAFTFIGVAFSSVSNLLAIVVLARGLTPTHLGEYYTIYALMMTVQLLTESGLSTVLTVRVLGAREGWKEVVAEATGLLLAVCALSVAVLMGVAVAWAGWQAEPALLWSFGAASVACVALQVQQFAIAVFRALERFEFESCARVLQGVVFLVLAALLLDRGPRALEAATAALATSHLLAGLFLVASLHRGWRCLGLWFRVGAFRGWLAESVPLALGDLFRRLTLLIDSVLLSVLTGSAAAVAIYNVACRPLAGLCVLPRLLLWTAFPSFVRMAEGSREVMARAFATSTRLLWVTSLPLAVIVCVAAEPIALLLGGPEYLAAAAPLRILVWILNLVFLSTQFRLLLTALGRQRLYVLLVAAIFVVETGLEAALVPWGSYLGLCVGFLLGEILYVLAGLAVCRHLGLRGLEWGRLASATLGALVMGVCLWPARALPLPLLGGISMVAMAGYFVFAYAVGAVRPEEASRVGALGLVLLRPFRARPQPPALGDDPSNINPLGERRGVSPPVRDPS